MQYLAHIENRPFMRWQTELLYESMRLLGIEDDFVLAYSQSQVPLPPPGFPHVFEVPHVGVAWGNAAMTKPYALYTAIKDGHIRQPCVLIDADVVLKRPVPLLDDPISCQHWPYMEREILQRHRGFGPFPTRRWWPVGSVYQFNNAPASVFDDIVACVKLMADTFKKGDGRLREDVDYWCCEMVGMALGLAKSDLDVLVVQNFESHLDHRKPNYTPDVSVIHYCNHFVPVFYKRAFDEAINPTCGTPYSLLVNLPDLNDNLSCLRSVARSLVRRKCLPTTEKALTLRFEDCEIRCGENTVFVADGGRCCVASSLVPGQKMYESHLISVDESGEVEVWL